MLRESEGASPGEGWPLLLSSATIHPPSRGIGFSRLQAQEIPIASDKRLASFGVSRFAVYQHTATYSPFGPSYHYLQDGIEYANME